MRLGVVQIMEVMSMFSHILIVMPGLVHAQTMELEHVLIRHATIHME